MIGDISSALIPRVDTEAIESITSLLPLHPRRKESSFNLGSAETKLLYTLHWILLDAADECIIESENAGTLDKGPFAYLFPISAITVSSERPSSHTAWAPSSEAMDDVCMQALFLLCAINSTHAGVRLPLCADLHPHPRIRLHAELPPGQRQEDLEGALGT